MFCSKCGNVVSNEVMFCNKCGAQQSKIAKTQPPNDLRHSKPNRKILIFVVSMLIIVISSLVYININKNRGIPEEINREINRTLYSYQQDFIELYDLSCIITGENSNFSTLSQYYFDVETAKQATRFLDDYQDNIIDGFTDFRNTVTGGAKIAGGLGALLSSIPFVGGVISYGVDQLKSDDIIFNERAWKNVLTYEIRIDEIISASNNKAEVRLLIKIATDYSAMNDSLTSSSLGIDYSSWNEKEEGHVIVQMRKDVNAGKWLFDSIDHVYIITF